MGKLSYWERRQLKVKARQLDNSARLERVMQAELVKTYHDIAKEASMWVDRYAKNQGVNSEQAMKSLQGIKTKHWQMTLEQFEAKAKQGGYETELNNEYYRSRIARLSALEEQIRRLTKGLARKHAATMRTALSKQYDDTYMRTTYNIQAQQGAFTADFAQFNETQLEMIVSSPWTKDGKDFSKRIWQNYQQELPSYLMDSLFRATVMGWGPQKVGQMMHAQFQDVQRNRVHNLVTSEMGHIAEEATAKSYEESDIDEYEYMATLESHTCTICGHLDGKRFKMSERQVGVNYPLIHARCRCTTVPFIADLPDVGERWMRDPETGKGRLIKNVKFDEWKRQYVDKDTQTIWNTHDIRKLTTDAPIRQLREMSKEQIVSLIDEVKRPRPDIMQDVYHGAYRQNMLDRATKLGYDALPTSISQADAKQIPDKAKIYRYTDRKQQFLYGALEYSTTNNSLNGRGIYFGTDYEYARDKYGGGNSELVTAVMSSDAIIVEQLVFQAEVQQIMKRFDIDTYPDATIGEMLFDIIGMQLGIDGWYNSNGDKYVVLNRGKLGVINESK
ncbi:hypothetical protein MH1LPH_10840 [Lactiplantibacillus brownii]